jgi:SNF2 family DNA or RNA helicase
VDKPKLYEHQHDYLLEHTGTPYHGLLWEMGSAKTRAILEEVNRLVDAGKLDVLVVIAPNGVHTNWSKNQCPLWLDVPYDIIEWGIYRHSKKWAKHATDLINNKNKLAVIVMSVDSFTRKNNDAHKFISNIVRRNDIWAYLVIDESTTISNPKANRSKNIVALAQRFNYRRILTGTPITESPFDIWNQGEALKKGIWGMNFFAFRKFFGEFETATFGPRSFQKLVSYRNLNILREKMGQFTSEVKKSDCLDLPPKVYEVVHVEMSTAQQRAYNEMKVVFSTRIEEEVVTAVSAMQKLQKLHQIVTGTIIDDAGNRKRLEHNRIKILKETLARIPYKTIIYAQYVENIVEIMEELGDEAVEYSGRIGKTQRETAVDSFQTDDATRYIVISLSSGGAFGLDLFAAGCVIYYGNGYSLERRMQSEDRAHRPGQSHDRVVYVDLITPNTVDEQVQEALMNKIDVGSQVTGLMQDWLR